MLSIQTEWFTKLTKFGQKLSKNNDKPTANPANMTNIYVLTTGLDDISWIYHFGVCCEVMKALAI